MSSQCVCVCMCVCVCEQAELYILGGEGGGRGAELLRNSYKLIPDPGDFHKITSLKQSHP